MRGKKAKELRREEKAKEAVPVGTVKVHLLNNNRVRVENIPPDFNLAMHMITQAVYAVTGYFVKRASEGGLEPSRIIKSVGPIPPGFLKHH